MNSEYCFLPKFQHFSRKAYTIIVRVSVSAEFEGLIDLVPFPGTLKHLNKGAGVKNSDFSLP